MVKAHPKITSFILKNKDCHQEKKKKEEKYLHSSTEEHVEI